MRFLPLFLLFALPVASQTLECTSCAVYGKSSIGSALLPDKKVTPGAIRTTDSHEICAKNFRTGPYRKTTASTKKHVYFAYGVEPNKGKCKGGCEVDHLIPLELGGLDDIKNLWPQPSQPKPGFHEKDVLENRLHKAVCEGRISLVDAQEALRGDWYKALQSFGGK